MTNKIANIRLRLRRCMALLPLVPALAACSSDGDEPQMPVDDTPNPQIIVMYSPGGLGDSRFEGRSLG